MKKKTFAGLAAIGAALGLAAAVGVVTSRRRKLRALMGNDSKPLPPKRNIYFAGGGISALAGAYYLIHDCGVPGECIHIFEESNCVGGAFNVGGDAQMGYVCAVPKLLSLRNHANVMDMLKGVPSVNLPGMSVKDEIMNYISLNPADENARLIGEDGEVLSGFGISKSALKNVKLLLSSKDKDISELTVAEFFADTPEFIESNLWSLISSAYMIKTSSSAVELKHILNCVAGEITELYSMKHVLRAQFNLQETVIAALEKYLETNNVNFATHCSVIDADFDEDTMRVSAIHLDDNGTAKTFYLNKKDLLFITNGSVSECATTGDYNGAAPESGDVPASAYLWRKLYEKRDGLGNPNVFYSGDVDTEVISFTVTMKSPVLYDAIRNFTGNTAAHGVLTTFKDSPWGLTVATVPQPYFASQPDDVWVICGYGVNTAEEGAFVDRTMHCSSGAEILFELIKFLGLEDNWEEISGDVINVIPCAMPYAGASSLPFCDFEKPLAYKGDECNFAFIGQFAKLGGGISCSSEYAVRTAREAVYRMTETRKSSTPPPRAIAASYLKMFAALRK